MGHLRVTVSHFRVTMGHLRVTIGHLKVTVAHLRLPYSVKSALSHLLGNILYKISNKGHVK